MADGFLTSSDIQGEPLLNHCYRVTAVVVAVQLGRGRGEGRRRVEHTYTISTVLRTSSRCARSLLATALTTAAFPTPPGPINSKAQTAIAPTSAVQ